MHGAQDMQGINIFTMPHSHSQHRLYLVPNGTETCPT